MTVEWVIRPLDDGDPAVIAAGFAAVDWPGKPEAKYVGYLEQQRAGTRDVLVATVGGKFAGYVTVRWESAYFGGLPEIQDFNVLPPYRRRGVGTALMDAAEALAAERSGIVGIGVGLYADYGQAQRMYFRRGYLPDGRGLMYDGRPVPPGETIRIDDDATLMFTKALSQPGIEVRSKA
jgi:GNAT superfamily N-acetyltransferase